MRILAALVLATSIVSGCAVFTGMAPAPTPTGCRDAFSPARCTAIADRLAADAGVVREDITSIEILPPPTLEVRDGVTILRTTSGGSNPDIRVTYVDGTTEIVTLFCGGIAGGSIPWCMEDPSLGTGPQDALGAYHDVPEGSTPVPTIDPATAESMRPLIIDTLEIPIRRTGPHEVSLGEALVPNGILERAGFTLADDWPAGVTILDGVRLEIRAADGTVIWNIYEHGWREGTERVEAFLVFDVARFEPGATLGIRDVVVE